MTGTNVAAVRVPLGSFMENLSPTVGCTLMEQYHVYHHLEVENHCHLQSGPPESNNP